MKNKTPKELLKRPYSRLLVADEHSGRFSARIVEFPGCFADGQTPEEAARNLETAAEAWLAAVIARGQQVPEPTGDVDYSGKFVVRLPRSLHHGCALYAQQENISLNQFVVYALAQHVGERRARDVTARKLEGILDDMREVIANRGIFEGRFSTEHKEEKRARNDSIYVN